MAAQHSMAGDAREDRDLHALFAEIKAILEGEGGPVSMNAVGSKLGAWAHLALLRRGVGLSKVPELCPGLLRVVQWRGGQALALCGAYEQAVPLQHPEAPERSAAPPSPGAAPRALLEASGIPRGKALEMLAELTGTPQMQRVLKELASHLLLAPQRTLLASTIGSQLTEDSRSFLRYIKVRVSQLLHYFPGDFELAGTGPAVTATYRHADLLEAFALPSGAPPPARQEGRGRSAAVQGPGNASTKPPPPPDAPPGINGADALRTAVFLPSAGHAEGAKVLLGAPVTPAAPPGLVGVVGGGSSLGQVIKQLEPPPRVPSDWALGAAPDVSYLCAKLLGSHQGPPTRRQPVASHLESMGAVAPATHLPRLVVPQLSQYAKCSL